MHKIKKRRPPKKDLPKKKKKVRKPRKPKKPKKKRYYRLRLPRSPRVPRPRFSFPRQLPTPKLPKPRKNKARTRQRLSRVDYHVMDYKTGASVHHVNWDIPMDTFSDRTVKPCNMTRVTRTLFSGLYRLHGPSLTDIRYATYLEAFPSDNLFMVNPIATRYVWEPFVNHLKVKKLATSNQADLLTAFAEFDDTIAMLNYKAIKSTSYGSIKWGWMPLVSDIMAANDAANNVKASLLSGNVRSQKYHAVHTISKSTRDIIGSYGSKVYHKWEVKVKYSGQISYQNDVLAFYDYMGFHPSPKLFWDLIPLSFAVDYILPIGDMLKALSPAKGWVKSVNFTGWRVITATVTEIVKTPQVGYESVVWNAHPGSITFVSRDYLSGVALEQKTFHKEIEALKTPSLEQIFDLSYLANAFHDRGKNLLSPHVYKKRRRK